MVFVIPYILHVQNILCKGNGGFSNRNINAVDHDIKFKR
jgi:hypothetical protein